MLGALPMLVLLGQAPPAVAPEYRFSLDGTTTHIETSETGRVSISIEPRPDKKLNLKSPLSVFLEGDGVKPNVALLGAAEAVTHTSSVSFSAHYAALRPGPGTLTVKARFFICDERVCERRSETRTLPVIVRAPPKGP